MRLVDTGFRHFYYIAKHAITVGLQWIFQKSRYNFNIMKNNKVVEIVDANLDGNFADLILILQSVYEDGDKFWENKKDWLLDNDGNRVYL
jgi:predicted lipid carrier protein YhbT